MNKLSDKEIIIQEQEKQIEEKEQEGSSDALISKDKEIIAAAEKLQEKERIHAKISKRLGDTEALSTRTMKKLNGKHRLIQEQAQMIKEKEKEKESKVILEAVENLKEKQRAHAEIAKRIEEAEGLT